MADPIALYLVAAGQFHDIDFARLELLKLLAEHSNIRVKVADSYRDIEAISNSKVLITYTCNLLPSEDEQLALQKWVEDGGKWFALHGTNSILEFLDGGGVNAPEIAPILMKTLGTQFIAHPPIQPFTVKTADADHELVKGIGEFETDDELYLSRIHGDIHQLLYADFSGKATGFIEEDWLDTEKRPLYYINKVGSGEVVYLNLGHCRGHYDMQPMLDYYPIIEKGSWDKPQFYELLRRGIRYCCGVEATKTGGHDE
jgi:type 1 glutamine amidotransferase